MGVSTSRKPRELKKLRKLAMASCRTRRMAPGSEERSHRWRFSSRKSMPCSFLAIGKSSLGFCTTATPVTASS